MIVAGTCIDSGIARPRGPMPANGPALPREPKLHRQVLKSPLAAGFQLKISSPFRGWIVDLQ